ncbi:hypothetical protein M6D81_11470 [Paenibacillus sp. J5C_2022]|uniref:deoxynucleotide monophosphate kinase family protein n=1 Tax=Paenibacillus sp. J5C2022 TaxID=2977129 RepID=UPI0021CEC7A6|nr:hypothetical protein [Paenibacillus sp. J5C2022]MCU6709326.1 hypothetical protein [Paenibacillus sp. J5C2022]
MSLPTGVARPNIALTGPLRSGKDEIGNRLCQRHGYVRFAFGDGIKDVCRRLYPDRFADKAGNRKKPRALLQGVGQALRQFDEDIWVRQCFAEIEDSQGIAGHYGIVERAVITDLRQPNEYERCRAEGFVIIRVKAAAGLRIQRAVESSDTFAAADLTHETEQHTDGFDVDYEIVNDGTLDELYRRVDELMTEIDGGAS